MELRHRLEICMGVTDYEHIIADSAIYEGGGRRPGRIALDAARAAARDTDGFLWIGVQQPTQPEIEAIAATFELPRLAVEDAVKAHQRPKLEVYDGVLFVVLK